MEAVIVAVIGGVFAILTVIIQRGRKENKYDHNLVVQSLNRIEIKIDGHINDHAKGEFEE